MRSGLCQKITCRDPLPLNAFVPSSASRLLPILYDENFVDLDIDIVLHALGPLSLAYKQRRDSLLHEYTGGGGHQTMQLQRREGEIGGRLSSQMSVLGRQEERDRPGLHGGQMKSGVLYTYALFTDQENLQS